MGPLQWYKNAVVCGDVDFCCLLCELTFRTEDDVARHIRDQKHTEALIASSYSHNHSTELIRKIKQCYYCEPCNTVLSSSRKVTSHLAEDKHQLNKTVYQQGDIGMPKKMLKRIGQNVIAFDDILIEELAWNVVIDKCCVVCDIDLDDVGSHIVIMEHVIKLIQTKVHSGIGNTLFRKIDDTLFQCLTCNTIIPQTSFVIHWDTVEHEKAHTKCKIAKCEAIPTEPAVPVNRRYNTNDKVVSENLEIDVTSDNVANSREITSDKTEMEMKKMNNSKQNENTSGATPKLKVSTNKDEPFVLGQKKTITQSETVKTKTKNIDTPLLDLNKELGIKNYSWIQEDGNAKCILCDWAMESSAVSRHTNSDHHRMIEKLHKEDLKNKQSKEKKRKECKQSSESNKLNKANQPSSDKSNYDRPKLDETIRQQETDNKIMENTNQNVNMTETFSGEVNREILDMVVDLQNDDVQIDFIYNKAYCKRCDKKLDFNPTAIKAHTKDHKDVKAVIDVPKTDKIESASGVSANGTDKRANPNNESLFTTPVPLKKTVSSDGQKNKNTISDSSVHSKNLSRVSIARTKDKEIDMFSRVNDISFTKGNPEAFCRACEINIPSTLKCLKEHAAEVSHRNKIASKNKPPTVEDEFVTTNVSEPQYKHETTTQFINRLQEDYNNFSRVMVVNRSLCLEFYSFHLCKKKKNHALVTCICCTKTFSRGDFDEHVNGLSHQIHFNAVPVIKSLKEEFVREVSDGQFHCGFCHEIVSEWNSLKKHLKTPAHLNRRKHAERSLAAHCPLLGTDAEKGNILEYLVEGETHRIYL